MHDALRRNLNNNSVASAVGQQVGAAFRLFAIWSMQLTKPSEKEIAARAYRIWEEAGMPNGKDEEFWRAAEQELLNEEKSNPMRTPDTL